MQGSRGKSCFCQVWRGKAGCAVVKHKRVTIDSVSVMFSCGTSWFVKAWFGSHGKPRLVTVSHDMVGSGLSWQSW